MQKGRGMTKEKKGKLKKVYVCKICNTYLTKDAEEAIPLCCGKGMIIMDELFEDDAYEMKDSAGGL